VYLQLIRDGTACVVFYSNACYRGEFGDEFDSVANRLSEALSEYLDSDEYFEISSEIEEYSDLTELELQIEKDDDKIQLIAEVYTSDWNSILPFKLVNKMFRSVYSLAGLEDFILKQVYDEN